ncbi:MAG: FKBP-type peptidyl-prolyl cis-trans isomerase [Saprospiraceae bacterium]
MKNFSYFMLLAMTMFLFSCGGGGSDYSKDRHANPSTQVETDQNVIIDYLEANGIKAQRTESGIYYVIDTPGTGSQPVPQDFVSVHYEGFLLDSAKTVFDSSYKRNAPAEFSLQGVVQGWQEGIPLFKEGGKGTIYIPSGLAYGERGAGALIKPNSVLGFKVELLEVLTAEEMQAKKAAAAEEAQKEALAQMEKDEEIIKKYISDNKLKATRTEEGVYVITDKAGSAAKPTLKSEVTVHYEGTLLDGSKFDSSFDKGEPITFPLGRVVPGWQIGIPQFGKGGKGTLLIPSGLAYGPRGAGADIPPNSVLKFRVELIDFK